MAEFKRDPAREAAAIARGTVTKEEIERRGGINASGYFGDSFNPNTSLSDAEYAAAIAGKTGEDAGKAINAALEAKTLKNNQVITPGTGAVLKTAAQIAADEKIAEGQGERQSAYDLLYSQFKLYGLESLVDPLKGLITSGASPAEFTIKLRDSDAYKKRFAANAKRIANGFKAIDEASYLELEDRYQSIMQNYGLPDTYYKKGATGVQEKFEDLISKNVDPVTLEERIVEGVKINKGSKALIDTAKQFYPNLTDGDFLAYALDPKNALADIKRKVTAIEIGGAAVTAGLQAGVARAEELGTAGITGAQAQQGFRTIAGGLQRGSQLAAIYGEGPYTQTTAEKEVFGLTGQTEAQKEREKLTGLEQATFGKKTGISSSALSRDRAGAY